MSFIEVKIKLEPYFPFQEILIASLSNFDFDSFVEEEPYLKAYTEKFKFDDSVLKSLGLDEFEGLDYKIEINEIQKENWNKQWEDSFEPVVVGDFCAIRAPFHQASNSCKYEIIIEPKMSFGTGHHDTTKMMIEQMQRINFTNKSVLDMGSGTGVLAILAEKMNASLIHAIDIEEWASENMTENFEKNSCSKCEGFLGDVNLLNGLNTNYDCILANINKNILLKDLADYTKKLNANGNLVLSGFFHFDNAELIAAAESLGLTLKDKITANDWSSLSFVKK